MATNTKWTQEDVDRHKAKKMAAEFRTKRAFVATISENAGKDKQATALQRTLALGRLPGGVRNKTESAYERLLEVRLGIGEIKWFKFEPINIRLGPKCFYSVDFLVMLADGAIEGHEVKGRWTDDGLAKFKIAAASLPFKFKAIRMVKGNFETILEI